MDRERTAGASLRVALSALAMTEYLATSASEVLFVIDNIFRFSQGIESFGLLGKPFRGGYSRPRGREGTTDASLRTRRVP